jgi:hypothetical protein
MALASNRIDHAAVRWKIAPVKIESESEQSGLIRPDAA